jgi:hypothetical protein
MPDFDTSVPHIARVYDYRLGGKDNFAADRAMGERTVGCPQSSACGQGTVPAARRPASQTAAMSGTPGR